MTLSFIYWLILLLAFLFNGWWCFRPNGDRSGFIGTVPGWVLFFIIGLRLFGWPITG